MVCISAHMRREIFSTKIRSSTAQASDAQERDSEDGR